MTPHHPLCTGAVERGDCEACRREAGRRDDLRAAWKRDVEKNGILVEVKGDKHTVALAAASRKIPFAFVREYRGCGVSWMYTVGRVGIQHIDRVRAWNAEPAVWPSMPAGGYAVGTIICFSDPDDMDSGPRR